MANLKSITSYELEKYHWKMESITNENWCIPCIADGEESKPSPMELESMYQRLETGEVFELSWRNPGRRLPSSTTKDENETPENANIDTCASYNYKFSNNQNSIEINRVFLLQFDNQCRIRFYG